MDWQLIGTAPGDGTPVDLYAKKWLPAQDRFLGRRFCFYQWGGKRAYVDRSGRMYQGGREGWVRAGASDGDGFLDAIASPVANEDDWLPSDWHVTHWMPIPDAPEIFKLLEVGAAQGWPTEKQRDLALKKIEDAARSTKI